MTFLWVEQQQELETLCQKWQQEEFVALDTEFLRTKTFYPVLGLVQVADGDGQYLIDPLAIDDLSPLGRLIADPSTLKVVHAGSEDIELFHCAMNTRAQALYDTQIGAAFLGQGTSIGYARLVKAELDVDLPKDETRSDWTHRPLTDSQKEYAALDVKYLYELYKLQKPRLEQRGRMEWVLEDSERLVCANQPQDPNQYYLKIRQAWQLKGQKLWILQELAAWRERLAMVRDLPRSRILRDSLVFEVARNRPLSMAKLSKIHGLYPGFTRRYGDHVLEIIKKADDVKRTDYPARIQGPLKIEAGMLLKYIREQAEQMCEQLELPLELVAKKKMLEQLVYTGTYSGDFELTDHFKGWRRSVVGEQLQALLITQWQNMQEQETEH